MSVENLRSFDVRYVNSVVTTNFRSTMLYRFWLEGAFPHVAFFNLDRLEAIC